jgi:hypothetical protein
VKIEELKALLLRVTPGSWLTDNDPKNGFVYALNSGGANRFVSTVIGVSSEGLPTEAKELHSNAELMAAAPDLARLVIQQAATLERVQVVAERLDSASKGIYFDLPDDSTPENLIKAQFSVAEAYTLQGCADQIRAALRGDGL